MESSISRSDIELAQQKWGESIIRIGKIYSNKGEYKDIAQKHVENFYAFDLGQVLFKPTLASKYQFRLTKESALSYFIGGNPLFPRDTGFALKPWLSVQFENAGFIFMEKYSIAMGNYFFEDLSGNVEKVEYTMGFFRAKNGDIKINLHHSSLPYKPGKGSKN